MLFVRLIITFIILLPTCILLKYTTILISILYIGYKEQRKK